MAKSERDRNWGYPPPPHYAIFDISRANPEHLFFIYFDNQDRNPSIDGHLTSLVCFSTVFSAVFLLDRLLPDH